MTNDELFNKLTEQISIILIKLDKPVKQYRKTREELTTCDVSLNADYRKNFANFYRLARRNSAWKDHYFALLEQCKHMGDVSFFDTLLELKARTGRIEPSFCSKLIATINPQRPVIDSIVLGVLNYKQPYYYQTDRCEQLNTLYQKLNDRMQGMLQDTRFIPLKQRFQAMYSDYSFTDIKIMDFILWQLREAKTS